MGYQKSEPSMISDEAVEAAAKAFIEHGTLLEALEAAAPILLSHEREQTRLAHLDAMVNRDTAERLERELENAKADAWDEGRESVDFDSCGINPYRSQG
jgi:hypothetical protein